MSDQDGSGKVSGAFKAKKMVVQTSLLLLGVAFELVSKHCKDMQDELSGWDAGRVLALGVLPDGPFIAVRKELDHLVYLGKGDHGARIKILFKNIDAALVMLTGQVGAHTGFAEHRAIVHGSINEAMQANRAMALVTKFLFPGIWLKYITKRPPKMSLSDYKTYFLVTALIGPTLALNATK
ncbi:MAG TPA: hypothetical protein VM658_21880 [bacterium]|nr:hypothetical protein [bacterium]